MSHAVHRHDAPLRVAVVGSGLAGLTAAYFLVSQHDPEHTRKIHVTLYERSPMLGMDSESVTVEHHGQTQRIDVPMRAFSASYYPNLVKLYKHLKVPFAPASFSFSYARASTMPSDRIQGPVPDFLYSGLHNRGKKFTRRGVLAHPLFLFKMLWSYVVIVFLAWYHTVLGHTRSLSHPLQNRTFGQWCDAVWIFRSFADELLFPMFCSIITADLNAVRCMPAAEVLDYVAHTFLYDHYRVKGGVSQVVRALTAHIPSENIHLGTTITDVFPFESVERHRIGLRFTKPGGSVSENVHDHIIFASQATQTANMLQWYLNHLTLLPKTPDLDKRSTRCAEQLAQLRCLRYEKSTVVCHTDTAILPPESGDWRDLNFVTPARSEMTSASYTMATHVIWRTPDKVVMQTTNPLECLFPAQSKWISKSTFDRFVLDFDGRQARQHFFQTSGTRHGQPKHVLGPLQGPPPAMQGGGVFVSGSWSYGVPLLEGCVTSGRLVAERILKDQGLDTTHITNLLG